jgi:dolichyl-phosphate beta-glucosyltransferase
LASQRAPGRGKGMDHGSVLYPRTVARVRVPLLCVSRRGAILGASAATVGAIQAALRRARASRIRDSYRSRSCEPYGMTRPCIVVPCYNEAKRLDRAAFETFLAEPAGATLLFVDDGSTDDTRVLLDQIVEAYPARSAVLSLATNSGKAEAVRTGMRTALERGAAVVGFWDADLATPLPIIAELAAVLDADSDIDVVMGSRVRMLGRHIDRSGMRHLIGRTYATLASVVLGLPVYDTQCGAKLFRATTALRQALVEPFRSRWSFDVELLQRLQRSWGSRGIDRIVEVPLHAWYHGSESKVSLGAGGRAFGVLFILLLRNTRSLPLLAERSTEAERYLTP